MQGLRPILLATVLLLVGCLAGDAAIDVDAADPGTARLRVTQHQLACCYMEGQVSYLQVINARNQVVTDLEFRAMDMIHPALDETLPAGTYTLRTWQRPCSGNCGALDPPRNQCETVLELAPGTETFITSAFTPGEGCSHRETAEPLSSPIPDSFAFREKLMSCGDDFPRPVVLGIQGRSPARTCFLDAWENSAQAEVSVWARVSERAVRPGFHRILPDRRIEVFVAPENPRAGDVWTYYQCAGLERVDDIRVFILEDCNEPVVLDR